MMIFYQSSVCIPGVNGPPVISMTSSFGVGAISDSLDDEILSAILSTTYSQQELVGLVQNVLDQILPALSNGRPDELGLWQVTLVPNVATRGDSVLSQVLGIGKTRQEK